MKRRMPLRAALHVQACKLVLVRGARRGRVSPSFRHSRINGPLSGGNRRFNVRASLPAKVVCVKVCRNRMPVVSVDPSVRRAVRRA